jgi:hypothetical protein
LGDAGAVPALTEGSFIAMADAMQIVGSELARDLSSMGLAKEDSAVKIACKQASYTDRLMA